MELARAKVSKFVREKFAETKVNQQTLSKVYSCCAGGSTCASLAAAVRERSRSTEVVLKKKKKMKRTVSHGSRALRKHRQLLTSSPLALAFSAMIHATTTESQRT